MLRRGGAAAAPVAFLLRAQRARFACYRGGTHSCVGEIISLDEVREARRRLRVTANEVRYLEAIRLDELKRQWRRRRRSARYSDDTSDDPHGREPAS